MNDIQKRKMINSTLFLEKKVGLITLNRPEFGNAYCKVLLTELIEVLKKWDLNKQIVLVVISAKGKYFCTGGDVNHMLNQKDIFDSDKKKLDTKYKNYIQKLALLLRGYSKLTLAYVDGPAIGAGFGLALYCDFIAASERASFQLPFIDIGLVPGDGSFWLLSQKIGESKSKKFLFTGKNIDYKEGIDSQLIDFQFISGLLDSDILKEVDNHFQFSKKEMIPLSKNMELVNFRKNTIFEFKAHLQTARKFQVNLQTSPLHLKLLRKKIKK